jgi:hypothetical protein
MPLSITRRLPPLSSLVRQTLADDARGDALRGWLADARGDVRALAELLER